MTTRDPRRRAQRYDGPIRRQQFIRWLIVGVRGLAMPTVLLSLLLAVDVVLPGTEEEGIVYRRTVDAQWVGPDGFNLAVGWPHRSDCLEERTDSGKQVLFTMRPGCSGPVGVSAGFGRQFEGGDTLRVERTPVYGQVRAVQRTADGDHEERYSLLGIGLYVAIGFLPVLSLGNEFAVYSSAGAVTRYHAVYVLPALCAEALHVWLFLRALGVG